jgi:phosphohistidine phosphatase
MELYILRHGIADDGQPGEPDSDRALTSEGKKKLRAVLKLARFGGVNPTLVMTSPYRRAVETATLAVEVLGCKCETLRTDALTPAARPEAVWDELRIHKDEPQVLLAGHEPLFSGLTAYLLQSPNLQVDFKKGAIVRIDVEKFSAEPRGILKWMLIPRLAK